MPSLSPVVDSPMLAAFLETVKTSSRLAFSSATMAVIVLVSDAIAECVSAERDHKTLPSASQRIPYLASMAGASVMLRPRSLTAVRPT